jgi:hypothetical protein
MSKPNKNFTNTDQVETISVIALIKELNLWLLFINVVHIKSIWIDYCCSSKWKEPLVFARSTKRKVIKSKSALLSRVTGRMEFWTIMVHNRGPPEHIVKMERSGLHVSWSDLRKAHQNKITKRWLSKRTTREQTILNEQQQQQ